MEPMRLDALGRVVRLGFLQVLRSSTAGLAWSSALGALGCTGCGPDDSESSI